MCWPMSTCTTPLSKVMTPDDVPPELSAPLPLRCGWLLMLSNHPPVAGRPLNEAPIFGDVAPRSLG